MSRSLRAGVVVVLCGSLCGCALFQKKEDDIPEATLPTWLGRVVMVDAGYRFALIDTGGSGLPPAGTGVLTFREKRRTSILRVTPEARPPYLALEIVEGLPAVGDQAALDEARPAAAPPADS
jgi:hypothetical protein